MIDRGGFTTGAVGALRRHGLKLAYALVLAGYAAALLYFLPPKVMLSREPVSGQELDTHVVQTWRVVDALERHGKSWAYDPQLLAGCPQGVVFDADNKAWELWTFALTRAGVPRGTAFNLFVAAVHLLVPLLLFASGGLFGLARVGRLALVALGLLVWCFDSTVHWAWWVGMVSWAAAGVLCLPVLGLFWRFLEEGRPRYALGLAPVLAAVHLVHPYAFFVLVVPMTAMYARAFRGLGRGRHLAIVGIAAGAIAANAWWILVDLRFWHYVIDSGFLGAATPGNLPMDYLGIVVDRADSGGAGMRSGFRFLALALAAVTLWLWRREGDRRFLPFAVALGALLALAYAGSCLPPLRQIQPYRFAAPLAFLACVPAAHLVGRLWEKGALRNLPARALAVLAIAAAVAIPRLVTDALYFLPPLVPRVDELRNEKPKIADPIGFSDIGYPAQPEYRYAPIAGDNAAVIAWTAKRAAKGGRFAVESWTLGEQLAWRTRAEVLGGFRLRNLAHTAADFFRLFPRNPPPEGALRAYLRRYAVRYVIATVTHERFRAAGPLLEEVAAFGPHVVFESRLPVSLFAEGAGKVRSSLNRISVRGTEPREDVVLRYHWLETLRCEPGCRVRREPLKGDPVGFVRVPAPHPADFEIVNRY